MPDTDAYTELDPIPDAHLLTCPDCGSQLLARPGDAIAHDDSDGTHVFFPASVKRPMDRALREPSPERSPSSKQLLGRGGTGQDVP